MSENVTPRPGDTPLTREMSRRFALIERMGGRIGLALMLVAFAAYLTGWMEAYIEPERLLGLLKGGVASLVAESGQPTGWGWLAYLGYSDMLSLSALVLLVLTVGVAFLGIIPVLIKHGDRTYLVLVLLQLAIFLLAGSNLLGPGGH